MKIKAAATFCALLLCVGAGFAQQAYPTRPITIVDAYPPGGSTDILSRIIGKRLQERLGQAVIIEARPGAGGTIGANSVARAAPDGYTIMVGTSGPNALAQSLYANLPYDVETDFAPIMVASLAPMLLCVSAKSPVKTVPELIALARNKSSEVNLGSGGIGSISHVMVEMFNANSGVHMTHVPYKGATPLALAIQTGEVSGGFLSGADAQPFVNGGKVRCIASASVKRADLFPDVPTFGESNVKNVDIEAWIAYLAPAKTPPAIVAKLQSEISQILAEPAIKAQLTQLNFSLAPGTSAELAKRIKSDRTRFAEVVKSAGIKLDQ